MSSSKKRLTAAFSGIIYFGFFSLLDSIICLNTYLYVFLFFLSGFEYVGIERLLCTASENKPASFGTAEFFGYAVIVPLLVYSVCAAAGVRLGTVSLGCSAAAALGTVIYRGIFYVIEIIFDI